jgi:prophage regulatory protein
MSEQSVNTKLQFVSIDEVKEMVHMSRSAIYRKLDKGEFPPKFSVGDNSVRFLKYEIEHYAVSMVEQKDRKETVEELLAMRKNLRKLVSYPFLTSH